MAVRTLDELRKQYNSGAAATGRTGGPGGPRIHGGGKPKSARATVGRMPSSMDFRISMGFSVLGLSLVRMEKSASLPEISPMMGRLR